MADRYSLMYVYRCHIRDLLSDLSHIHHRLDNHWLQIESSKFSCCLDDKVCIFLEELGRFLRLMDHASHPELLIGKRKRDIPDGGKGSQESFHSDSQSNAVVTWCWKHIKDISKFLDDDDQQVNSAWYSYLSLLNAIMSYPSREITPQGMTAVKIALDTIWRLLNSRSQTCYELLLTRVLFTVSNILHSISLSVNNEVSQADVVYICKTVCDCHVKAIDGCQRVFGSDAAESADYFITGINTVKETKVNYSLYILKSLLAVLKICVFTSNNGSKAALESLVPAVTYLRSTVLPSLFIEDFLEVLSKNDADLFTWLLTCLEIEIVSSAAERDPGKPSASDSLLALYHLDEQSRIFCLFDNKRMFLHLMFHVVGLDEETLIDMTMGGETACLEYLVKFCKFYSLSQVVKVALEETDDEHIHEKRGSDAIFHGPVLILCKETVIYDDSSLARSTSRSASIQTQISPHELEDADVNSSKIISADKLDANYQLKHTNLQSFLESFISNISRKYSKGILSFNPSSFCRILKYFLSH